jgi:hypothetical protein
VRGVLTAIIWKDKQDACILTTEHKPTAECNFCDERGRDHQPATVEDYSWHMGNVGKGERTADSYSVSQRTWKWTKKLYFHLLDLTILNGYIILISCGRQTDHQKFCLTSVQNLMEKSAREPQPQFSPNPQANHLVLKLDTLNTGEL